MVNIMKFFLVIFSLGVAWSPAIIMCFVIFYKGYKQLSTIEQCATYLDVSNGDLAKATGGGQAS